MYSFYIHDVNQFFYRFRIKPAFAAAPQLPPISSVSSTAAEIVQSPEADTSAPPPPPIVIYFRKSCTGGPLIDSTLLASSVEDSSPADLAKKLVNQILSASHKSEKILARLGTLSGEEMVITHEGNTYTIKLPQLVKASDLEEVFHILAQALGCCRNLFSKSTFYLFFK